MLKWEVFWSHTTSSSSSSSLGAVCVFVFVCVCVFVFVFDDLTVNKMKRLAFFQAWVEESINLLLFVCLFVDSEWCMKVWRRGRKSRRDEVTVNHKNTQTKSEKWTGESLFSFFRRSTKRKSSLSHFREFPSKRWWMTLLHGHGRREDLKRVDTGSLIVPPGKNLLFVSFLISASHPFKIWKPNPLQIPHWKHWKVLAFSIIANEKKMVGG